MVMVVAVMNMVILMMAMVMHGNCDEGEDDCIANDQTYDDGDRDGDGTSEDDNSDMMVVITLIIFTACDPGYPTLITFLFCCSRFMTAVFCFADNDSFLLNFLNLLFRTYPALT